MTLELKIGLALAAVFLLAAVGRGWLAERDAQMRAENAIQASQKLEADAAAQIKTLQEQDAARQEQTIATLEAMQKIVAQVKTPQQIAQWIPQQFPTPQPINVTIPPATPGNPNPPATAIIPQEDLPAIRDAIEQCKECSVKLSAAQADAQSKATQLSDAGQQLSAMTNERDAWKKAAKGTFWSRLKHDVKVLAIGAGITIAGICASGHCK